MKEALKQHNVSAI